MNKDFRWQARRFPAASLTDCCGKATQYAGEKPVQTVRSGYEISI